MRRVILIAALSLAGLLVLGQLLLAQSVPPGGGGEDPADAAQHGVARLSLAEGRVAVTRGNSNETIDAAVNAPVVASDRVSTGEGSRAELQFDGVNVIRLAPNSEVRLGDLQYHRYLVQVLRGTATFREQRDGDARTNLSTPNVSISPERPGTYRISVRPNGQTEITVRAGEASVRAAKGAERLSAGQTLFARGSFDEPEFMTTGANSFDEWDRWNADRDRLFETYLAANTDSARSMGQDMSGIGDLAANGRWTNDPDYGNVWVPNNVGVDWAPYRDGRWDYLDYYGWSWVSYDPWGWAPYHYGNWYRGRLGWAWYPGIIGPRRYWRPALVGFFGFGGSGFGAPGVGYSNVGWVPLAPHEAFRPWYGRGGDGRGFVAGRSGSIVGSVDVAGSYCNARYAGAVTGVRAGDFGRVGTNRGGLVRPRNVDLARAGVVDGAVPFAPARNSQDSGWRRVEAQPRAAAPVAPGMQSPRLQAPEAQPVRISPSIVNRRPDPPSPGFPPPSRSFNGFGGPRAGNPGVGNAAPPPRSGPRMEPHEGGNRGNGRDRGGGRP